MSNAQLILMFVVVSAAMPFVAYFIMKFGAFGLCRGIQLFQKTKKEEDYDGEEE